MKLIVFHGNPIQGMIRKISEIKKAFDPLSILYFSPVDLIDPVKLLPAITTPVFFSEERLIILEDYYHIDFLKTIAKDKLTLVLIYSKVLEPDNELLKLVKPYGAEIFKIEQPRKQTIFPLLDKLADKNPHMLSEIDLLLKDYGSQYIFTMIFYLLRRLSVISKNTPPYMLERVKKQQKNFPKKHIIDLYYQGLTLDFKLKVGLINEKNALYLLVSKFLM